MDDRETNILEAFVNMREFNRQNAADYADVAEAAVQFKIINDSIETMQNHAATQTSGARGQAVQQKSVLSAAIRRKLTNIARTARALNFNDEGFRRLFSVPNSSSQQKLLAAAREFAAEAAKHKADFLRLGMRASFIDDLNDDIADFEQAINDKAGAQGAGVGATAGIDAAVENGLQAADIADSILHNVYQDNPVKLAAWTQARHVKRSARRKTVEPPPTQ